MPRRNLLTNPSFETGVTAWTRYGVGGAAADPLAREINAAYGARAGSYYAYCRRSTAGGLEVYHDKVPITPGQTYAEQVQINRDGTGAVGLDLDWYTASDTYISTASSGNVAPASATWTTLSAVGVAPANAAFAQLYLRFTAQGAGQYVRWDAAMLEPATTVGSYADGDTAGWGWEGVAHASSSRESTRNECPSPDAVTGWGGGGTGGSPASSFTQNVSLNAGVMDGATAAYLVQSGLSGNARVTAAKKAFDVDAGGQWWSGTIQGWPEPPAQRCTNPVCATSLDGWLPGVAGYYTLARVTGLSGMVAATGARATNSAAATGYVQVGGDRVPVTPGETVTGVLQVRPSTTVTVTWYLNFYDAADQFLSAGQVTGPAVSVTAGSQASRPVSGPAPAGAAYARIVVLASVPAGATLTATGHRVTDGTDTAMEYAQTLSCAAELTFRNSSGAQIAATVNAPSVSAPTGAPVRVWAQGQAPAGTRSVEVTFLARAAGAKTKVWATAARLDQINDPALLYRDGDSAGWAWDGTAGQSASGMLTVAPVPTPLWKADTDSSSAATVATSIGYFGTQYQAGGGSIQNNYTPIPVEPAPGGRPGRATRITIGDNVQRYEHKPDHRSFDVGDDYFFSVAFYLDADFPIDANDFQVIEQIHQAWGSWSPPVAFEVQTGQLLVTGGNGLPNGSSTGNTQEFAHFQRFTTLERRRWYSLVYRIENFSEQTYTSRLSVWLDGAVLLDRWIIPCPTIVQGDAPDRLSYRKQGFYHRPSISGGTIWHAGAALGTSYEAVDPYRQLTSQTYQAGAQLSASAALGAAPRLTAATTAALAAASALSSAPVQTAAARASLPAAGALGVDSRRVVPGTVALPAAANLTGAAVPARSASAALAAAAALDAGASVRGPGSATLVAASGLTGSGLRTTTGAALFRVDAALSGAAVRTTPGDAVLAAVAALAGAGVRTTPSSAPLDATAALGTAAGVFGPGSAVLAATGSLGVDAWATMLGAAGLDARGRLDATGVRATATTAGLDALTRLDAAGTRVAPGAVGLVALARLDAPAPPLIVRTAAGMSAVGELGAASMLVLPAGAALAAAAALTAPAALTARAAGALVAAGTLAGFAGIPSSRAVLTAAGALTGAALPPIKIGTAGLAGIAVLTPGATAGHPIGAGLAAQSGLLVTAVAFTPAFIAPPAPRVPQTHVPTLRLLACDTVTGRVGYELPYSALSWDAPLNDIGTSSATLVVEAVLEHLWSQGAADPRLALREVLTGPYRYSFVVCWGAEAIWGGPYLPSDDLAADSTIKVGAVGMERMLDRRVLTNLDGSGGWADASRDVVIERTTPPGAVYQLVASAVNTGGGDRPQRALPIVCSDPPRIAGEESFIYKSYDLITAWKAISDIVARDDGPDVRLEPNLVERGDGLYVQWDLEIGRPYLVGSGPAGPSGPLPFVFDDASSQISRATDPVGMGTTFWAAGSGQDRDKVVVQASTTRLTDLGWPELETVSSSGSSETDDVKLARQVSAAADAGSLPTDSWTLKTRADGDPPRGAVRRGDPITIEALRTLLIEPGLHTRRVTKVSGSQDLWDDLTCDHEDALADGDPTALGWRPDTAPSLVPAGTVVVPGAGGVADSGPVWLATSKASKSDGSTTLAITSPASAVGQQLVMVGFTDTDGTIDGFTAPSNWSLVGASLDPHGGWGKVWTRLSTAADVGGRYVTGQTSGRSCVLYCLAFNQPLAVVDLKFTGGGQNTATTLTAEAVGAGAGSIEVGMWAGYDESGTPAYTVPAGWSKTTRGDVDSGYETGTLACRTLTRGGQTDEAVTRKSGSAVRWSAVTFALGTPIPRPAAGAARKITNLTGPGFSDRYGVGGTDLGVPRPAPDGRLVTVFGDTFSGQGLTGDWRTPVALYADPANITAGLRWTGAAPGAPGATTYAGQLVPDPHNATLRGYYVTTQLPTDVVTIGSTMYLHVMACEGLGNVHFTELYQSVDNGATWTTTGCWWDNGANQNHMFEMVTLERGGDGYVYCLSTTFSRDSGLQLRRVPEGQITDPTKWQTWGYANGAWAWGNPASVVLTGAWGELCLRRLPSGRWLFSGFDAGNYLVSVRDLGTVGPTTDLTRAPVLTLARGCSFEEEDHTKGLVGQLYGGYLIPGSTLAEAHFSISQWNTSANWPYRSMQFRANLATTFGGS